MSLPLFISTTTDRDGVTTRLAYEYNIDKTLKKVYNDSNINYNCDSDEKYNSYSYDEYGNLERVSHGDMSYIFEYNSFGQLCGVIVGDCFVVRYNYAEVEELGPLNSSLISQMFSTELSDLEQSFVYDKLGNVIGKKNNGTYIQKWAYDKLGNLVFENDLEDGTQTSYQYDAQSRLTQRKSSLLGNHSFTSQYLYNSDSNITEAAYNFTGTNSYDNSPINITFSDLYHYDDEDGKFLYYDSGNARNQTSYDDDDSITSRTSYYKNSDGTYRTVATETYSYYTSNQEGTIKDAVWEISYGNDTISYEYAANGNIIAEYKNGETSKSYVYDKLGQLVECHLYDYETVVDMALNSSLNEEIYDGDYIKILYTYNSGNNMTSYTTVFCGSNGRETTLYSKNMQYGNTMWYDQLCNYNETTDTYSHTYDYVGNLLSDERYEYTWENGRELTRIKQKGYDFEIAAFEYDSSGLRISRTTDYEGTIYFVYDENSNLIFEKRMGSTLAFHYDGNGVRTHFDYIYDNTVTGTYYYRYNLQGDVIALLDSTGQVVAEYTYDPYGNLISYPTEIGEINPFTYRGYYYDWATGLYYLQSRYYNPETCRFINADDTNYIDASGTLLGLNLYTYCENDPINSIDPTGYGPWSRYLTLVDYKFIHKQVQNYAAGRVVGFTEVYVKGNKGKGYLDVYDPKNNEYYEVKSSGAAYTKKTRDQMAKYDVAKPSYGKKNVKRGNLYIAGEFSYGAWDITFEREKPGLIVYYCSLNAKRYRVAKFAKTVVLAAVITVASIYTYGAASPAYSLLCTI